MHSRSLVSVALAVFVACVSGCSSASNHTDGSSSAAALSGDEDDVTSTKVLLDCNVFESGGGPDQQATVIQRGDGLVLKELTNNGGMVERPLSQEEFDSQDIKLRLDTDDGPETINHLFKEGGDWMNESKSDGWRTFGNADCFTDKTRR